MKKILFDIAHSSDIGDLIKLEEICFVTDRLSAKQFQRFISSSTALVVVAKHAHTIIACAVVLFRKNSAIARLYSLAVDPQFQRQGIARSFNEFIEHRIRKHRCTEIRLEVRHDNQRAIHFYQQNGYLSLDVYKNFYEDGADAVRMRKIFLSSSTAAFTPHGIEIS